VWRAHGIGARQSAKLSAAPVGATGADALPCGYYRIWAGGPDGLGRGAQRASHQNPKLIEIDPMKMPDDVKRMLDNQDEMHKQDRDVLFENEKFLIGVLQGVSAGSIVAALSQSEQFVKIASVSLLVAIAAAFFKHQYKMWDVKTRAVKPLEDFVELKRRLIHSERYLKLMRSCLWVSFLTMAINLVQVVASVWSR
jgi:hypothetical protein